MPGCDSVQTTETIVGAHTGAADQTGQTLSAHAPGGATYMHSSQALNLGQTVPGRGLDLAVQRQPGGPGVWSRGNHGANCQCSHSRDSHGAHCQSAQGRGIPAIVGCFGARTGWHHRFAQQLGTEAQAGRPWAGVLSGSFPCGSAIAPYTPHRILEPKLVHTDSGRDLAQRQPRSQAAAQPPPFLQPQHPGPQPQPTPHHSLAQGLG